MVSFVVPSAKMIRNLKTPVEMIRYVESRNQNLPPLINVKDNQVSGTLLIHYLLKAMVVCLCTIGCMFQIATIVSIFFSYPTTVFVNVQTMDKLYLPGLTLCNGNRVMLSKLKSYDEDFSFQWDDMVNVTEDEDAEIKQKRQSLIDEYVRQMMNDLTVYEFMSYGHFADDFLIPTFFKCASDKFHPTEPCKKFANVITTTQDLGNCFTLFHRSRSRILDDNAIDSGLSQSPVRRGTGRDSAVNIEISEEPFHPNEIIRLKLDFHASEYTTLNEPILGHIIIHDNDEAPVIREKNFLLSPGFYYEFFLSKETDHLLPKPYSTDCVDHKITSFDGSEDVNEYLHHPLSRENCIIGCMAQNTMDKCNCWPPELPFMKGSIGDAPENKLKWCNWDANFDKLQKPANMTWFEFCFTINEDQCNDKCKYDCSIDRYRIIKEVRQWPATERIEHSKESDYLTEMRRCCAIVSIRYWSPEQTLNQYQAKVEPKTAEFTSYIGGLLSMWVGFSLLGVYDVMEAIVFYIRKKMYSDNTEPEQTAIDKVPTIDSTIGVTVYNDRSNYDEEYRKQMRRKTWQRKAKVAAIIERWTKSPHFGHDPIHHNDINA